MESQAVSSILLPEITGQPAKQLTAPGEIASFSIVVADAHAITFQWKFNSTDIPGATGDSLLLTNVNTANEGQYSVVVTNSAGSVTSTPTSLTLRQSIAISTLAPPRLTVFSDGGGVVTVTPKKSSYNLGETVTLTVTPLTDNVFAEWAGEMFDNNPRVVTMNENKVIRARFAPDRPQLIVFSDGGGIVTVTPMKRAYSSGETVTLTATPFAPNVFSGWTGDLSGSSNPATLTMDGNKTVWNKRVRARFASAVPAPIPPGLIALWRGETDASDSIDSHHGAFFAGKAVTSPAIAAPPGITAPGKVGQAFNFDGTLHIRVPDSAALKPVQQMTLEAWVFPTGITGINQTIIARGGSSLSFFQGTWKMRLSGLRPEYISHNGSTLQSSTDIPLNDWSHLAVTFDSLIKSIRIYVNGELAGRVTAGPATLALGPLVYDPTPVPVTIGADWQMTLNDPDFENHIISSPFHGRIDEVALYNRALTADEILSIYNSDFLGKTFSQPYLTSLSQLPDAILGANYMLQLTAILGTPPISFSSPESVLLPLGITLSSSGLLSGVPGTAGTFSFPVRVTDATDTFTEQLYRLNVSA